MSKKQRRDKQAYKPQTSIPTVDSGETFNPNNMTVDAFTNLMARMGAGTNNLNEGAEYPLTRLTKDVMLMTSLYRSHWIIRKIIDAVPEDMFKNWVQLTGEIEPDQVKKFNKVVRRTRTKAKLAEAMKWARLYGGAAALIMIEGQGSEEDLKQPLDLDTIEVGTYKGLLVLDRWSGITPMSDLVNEIGDAEFGLPDLYRVTLNNNKSILVHHSRLLRFIGRELPLWERQNEQYWGASEVEHIFDELKKRDNASWNIASLLFQANINVLKMADLGQLISSTNTQAQARLANVISAQNALKSNNGMFIMDKDDEYDTKQYSFGGVSDVYEMFMLDIAGAAEIPVTRLYGRSPAGMNSTGEADLQNYYEMIHEKQENELRPALDKLIPVILASEFGAVPEDFDFEFYPVNTSNDNDKAELGAKRTTSILDVYNAGIIGRQTTLKELKQMEEVTGMWSNITDEMIGSADDEVQIQDMPDLGDDEYEQAEE